MNKKIAVIIYPTFSMQEISCLTVPLSIHYEQQIDVFASTKELIQTEDGFFVMPDKTFAEFDAEQYSCLILPGILNPMPALFDQANIDFLKSIKGADILIAAISAAPILLAKAGFLDDVKFACSIFAEVCRDLDFIPDHNQCHVPLMHEKNIITAEGFAFREFATEVINALGLDKLENTIYRGVYRDFTEDELTYHMEEEHYQEFMAEYEAYNGK